MIFWLAIDGSLKKCLVREPYLSRLREMNHMLNRFKSEEDRKEILGRLREISAQVVKAGAYEVKE